MKGRPETENGIRLICSNVVIEQPFKPWLAEEPVVRGLAHPAASPEVPLIERRYEDEACGLIFFSGENAPHVEVLGLLAAAHSCSD